MEPDHDGHRTDVTMQLAKSFTIYIQVGQCLHHLLDELIRVLLIAEVECKKLVLGKTDCVN